MDNNFEIKITIGFNEGGDMENSLNEISRKLVQGYTAGSDSNDDECYTFEVTRIEDDDIPTTRMSREEVIHKITLDEIDTLTQLIIENSFDYVEGMVKHGITGFMNLSDAELCAQYYNRYGSKVIIV